MAERIPIERLESLEERFGIDLGNSAAYWNRTASVYGPHGFVEVIVETTATSGAEIPHNLQIAVVSYNAKHEPVGLGWVYLHADQFLGIDNTEVTVQPQDDVAAVRIYPVKGR